MCKNEQASESHAVQQQLHDACGSKRDRSPDAGDAALGAAPACETAFDPAEVLRAASAGRTDAVVSVLGLRVGDASHARDRCASEALLHAANCGHIDTVRALASACRADVEAVSDSGWSPVMYAACNGHSKVVVALIKEFGANPHRTTSVGKDSNRIRSRPWVHRYGQGPGAVRRRPTARRCQGTERNHVCQGFRIHRDCTDARRQRPGRLCTCCVQTCSD